MPGTATQPLLTEQPPLHRCTCLPFPALRRELFAQLVRVMRELAACAGCRPQDLALLPNATTGAAPMRRLQG